MAEQWNGQNQRKWHMSREVSLADVAALVTALILGSLAYSTVVQRVALLEQGQASIKGDLEQTTKRLETAMGEINHKLDRLIERR